ncbi:electron transfer DM13 family protein [Hydrogenophaga sp. RAC07]|uniref:DM13 domain-containing protein n=1 Tax=Hydrogenophaga sp. RAC07 TaxID=1842537 RepID=UPI00083DAEF6|nr:DM13 domain-containing protein [Hydrogenophaga sp. RAC07]AOF83923.1 electron transfer DM13 family protein [Hydrogenophaga sp. RAC07]
MTNTAAPVPRRRTAWLLASHVFALLVGFGAGIYTLPILTAPPGPSTEQVAQAAAGGRYSGEFRRDLKDSDPLHWGEGTVSLSLQQIVFTGRLAPGPDYKLYLSPEFVETEADFKRLKPTMLRVGDVKTFENFIVPLPAGADPAGYTSVIVWCETFGQFITAAKYRDPG